MKPQCLYFQFLVPFLNSLCTLESISSAVMDGPGQFNERNFEQNMPAFPRIYLSVIRPSLAEFFGVYFLTFGLYACLVGDLRMLGFVAEIAVVFLFIGVYSITKKVRFVLKILKYVECLRALPSCVIRV